MKVSDAYPSKWLAAADFDEPTIVTISTVDMQEFKTDSGGKEQKIILEFEEYDKPMVCNKTNANTLAKLIGGETNDWPGQKVIINAVDVQFGKEMVPALRFSTRKPKAAAAPAKAARPAPAAVVNEDADDPADDQDIPF